MTLVAHVWPLGRRLDDRLDDRQGGAALAVLAGALYATVPSVVHACPMCFTGNGSNSDAFVWGSLFLMVVPVTAIGSLLYWAYRRSRALEAAPPPSQGVVAASGEGNVRPLRRVAK